jgi:F-box and WD-40 domain protein 1/11/F-box/WD-40 domain protein 7
MKIVKTRAFKDRLKGHKDTIISINSPNGPSGGMLLSASKDG